MKFQVKIIFASILLFTSLNASATERIGRLGLGFTNQLQTEIPSLSIKLQRSKSFAYSAFFGIDTDETGGWNAGLKLYRNIFNEPQLTFYTFGLLGLLNKKYSDDNDKSGFEIDLGLGTEFSFTGLESLGFSIDFGVSLYKLKEFNVETMGNHFLLGSVHFYL
ncbi:hypothetical protein [Bacteriovorax sp. Seq25_V]|uniref:hypothetical protein n=1 Tax=Bacteriovorax sp. Seq25_V TaxID=1201288 RepID=UPI00038A36EB|nr:hypothetical protein [Bacteriovorax sp. Seq25_V]EQC46090.1 hypothetical protein M900_1584 [Bacteriovorax sp. Seq25_V]